MSENNNSSGARGGIGFLGALGILFIGLKLANVIAWPWWLVLLPLWAPLVLIVLLLVALLVVAVLGS